MMAVNERKDELGSFSGWGSQALTLPSGFRVITSPLPYRYSVGITLVVGGGCRIEPEGQRGISHFVEHTVFKGTRLHPNAMVLGQILEEGGGWFNGTTDKENIYFTGKSPRSNWKKSLLSLAEMVTEPLFDRQELEREKAVVLEEMNQSIGDLETRALLAFERMLWPDSRSAYVGGERKSIESLDSESVRNWWAKLFRPENCLISVAGDVDANEVMDAVLEGFGPMFNSWSGQSQNLAKLSHPDEEENGPTSKITLIPIPGKQFCSVRVGGEAVGRRDSESPVFEILRYILGEGIPSRLHQRLREREGLGYDVNSFYNQLSDCGALGAKVTVKGEEAWRATRALLEEIWRVAEGGVNEGELERAKINRIRSFLFSLEDTLAVAALAGFEAWDTESFFPSAIVARWEGVTAQSVQAAARRIAADLRVVLVGNVPEYDEEILENLMLSPGRCIVSAAD